MLARCGPLRRLGAAHGGGPAARVDELERCRGRRRMAARIRDAETQRRCPRVLRTACASYERRRGGRRPTGRCVAARCAAVTRPCGIPAEQRSPCPAAAIRRRCAESRMPRHRADRCGDDRTPVGGGRARRHGGDPRASAAPSPQRGRGWSTPNLAVCARETTPIAGVDRAVVRRTPRCSGRAERMTLSWPTPTRRCFRRGAFQVGAGGSRGRSPWGCSVRRGACPLRRPREATVPPAVPGGALRITMRGALVTQRYRSTTVDLCSPDLRATARPGSRWWGGDAMGSPPFRTRAGRPALHNEGGNAVSTHGKRPPIASPLRRRMRAARSVEIDLADTAQRRDARGGRGATDAAVARLGAIGFWPHRPRATRMRGCRRPRGRSAGAQRWLVLATSRRSRPAWWPPGGRVGVANC